MTRVEIDLNVRVRGNWTFSGVDDADGPIHVGDFVEVYEGETGACGSGRIEEIDYERGLIYLSVDWASIRLPEPVRFWTLQGSFAQGVTVRRAVTRCVPPAPVHEPAIAIESFTSDPPAKSLTAAGIP